MPAGLPTKVTFGIVPCNTCAALNLNSEAIFSPVAP
jgi:hypothetical protein